MNPPSHRIACVDTWRLAGKRGAVAAVRAEVAPRGAGFRRGCGLVAGCMLAALLGLAPARAEELMPRVLILNSYHPGYGWSDGEMRGVMRALQRQRPTLVPSIEFLDARRFPLARRRPGMFPVNGLSLLDS